LALLFITLKIIIEAPNYVLAGQIIPAATVLLLASSITIKLPVA
jgi:hypothetical protein